MADWALPWVPDWVALAIAEALLLVNALAIGGFVCRRLDYLATNCSPKVRSIRM